MFERALIATAAIAVVLGGCTPKEDWSDPEYIQYRMELSDERAFDEFSHLSDEQKRELVPTLIAVYEGGTRQLESLRALVSAGDGRAKDVFLSALSRPDDATAALAARGLAAIGDVSSASAIADRLAQVTQHDAYPAFLDALSDVPTSEAADVVAGVLMRPASRIGGVGTVRRGCSFLGEIDEPSSEVLAALAFGLVNLNPQPVEDAMNECELALVRHGAASVPVLQEMFLGNNTAVNNHLTTLQYLPVVGQLRSGAVLSHLPIPSSTAVLLGWFDSRHDVPAAELERMGAQQASAWYDFHGQLFTAAVGGLAWANSADSLAMLRRLESTGSEGSALANFQPWFQLSAGAEFGLRTAVHEALMKAGEEADRELLWERATSGTVPTARGEYFNAEFRKNALHYVGRTARAGEAERFATVMAAQSNPIEFVMHVGYFALAEVCGDEVTCYAGALTDPSEVIAHELVTSTVPSELSEQDQSTVRSGIQQNIRTGAVWQLGKRLGGQPAASTALLDALDNPSMQVRFEAIEALHYVHTLPQDASEKLNAFLEREATSTAQGARDLRHAVRLLLATRT
jgi:hypothetical protein